MKTSWFFLALATSLSVLGQEFRLVHDGGPANESIAIVLLAEGYTAAEKGKFFIDASRTASAILENEAFAPFADHLAISCIFVESNESGATIPRLSIRRDTYFRSSFGSAGIDRLLSFSDLSGRQRATQLLQQFVPGYAMALILVNSTEYGGSGGAIGFASLHSSATEILLHESGHTFAHLADEYVDSSTPPNTLVYPNAADSVETIPAAWRAMILPETSLPSLGPSADPNFVAAFPGANYVERFFRPTFSSKMAQLGAPFGPVNLKAFADAAFSYAPGGIKSLSVTQPSRAQSGKTTLYAIVGGPGSHAYQWSKNGVVLSDETRAYLTLEDPAFMDQTVYAVTLFSGGAPVLTATTSAPGSMPAGVPLIIQHPVSRTVNAGQPASLSVTVLGDSLAYQWKKEGMAIVGATSATLVFPQTSSLDAGTYVVTVSNSSGAVVSLAATLTVVLAPDPAAPRLINISTRAFVGTGADVLIAGFIIGGTGPKTVLIRASGPALTQFGVSGILADPTLEIHDSSRILGASDNWGENPQQTAALNAAFAATHAFAWPEDSTDAAVILTLTPGAYTAVVSGKNDSTGVALIEVLEVDSENTAAQLVNISTRSLAKTDEKRQIAGFIIAGTSPKKVLIRASGPALLSFSVPGVLADPMIELHDATKIIAVNDDWSPSLAGDFVATNAFPWPVGSKDAALAVTLNPGNYTAVISGKNGTTGVSLIEVYEEN